MDFFVSGDWIQKYFDQIELQIKMSLSVQRSVVEQFSFNGKKFSQYMLRGKSASCQEMFTWQLDTRMKTVKKPFKI